MLRSWLLAALVVAVALSGCTSPPDEGGDEGDGPGSDAGIGIGTGDGNASGNASLSESVVAWTDVPTEANGTAISVSWQVDLANANLSAGGNGSAGNGSAQANTTSEIEETGVAFGFTSVAQPVGPDDYDNVTGQQNNTTSPGEFDATITPPGDGTLYLRAYAFSDGAYYWSEEAQVNVTGGAAAETKEIVIKPGTLGLAQTATFDPEDVTIQVGGSVYWNNTDSATHAIKVTGPEEADTGNIAAGEASTPIIFMTAGEYEYECTIHTTMEGGTITVEE